MSTPADLAKKLPPPSMAKTDGFVEAPDVEDPEVRLDEIEMLGEEEASGFRPHGKSEVSAGMRYLHCSRTIHQLVTDRNRAVGLYFAVASLLWTASSSLLRVPPNDHLIVPIETLQRWCLPVTFGAMTVLAVFTGFLLIRTRIGLIYEVAKMNLLLGLPVGRVKRINPLSIFFIMYLLTATAGGCSATFLCYHLLVHKGLFAGFPMTVSVVCGLVVAAGLVALYIGTVAHTTSDRRLADLGK